MSTNSGSPGRNTTEIVIGTPSTGNGGPSRRDVQAAMQGAEPIDYAHLPRRKNPLISVKDGGLCPTGFAGINFRRRLKKANSEGCAVLSIRNQMLHDKFWERRENEALARVMQGEPERLRQRTRLLINSGTTCVIAVANFKSSGKTTDALGIGSLIADFGRKPTLAMPATGNTATSNIGRRAGISWDTGGLPIKVTEISDKVVELKTARQASSMIPTTDVGLSVVSEDENEEISTDNEFPLAKFVELVMGLIDHYNIVILDMGNDNISRGSIGLAAIRFAHAIVFSTRANDEDTSESLVRTVRGCNSDTAQLEPAELFGHEPSADELRRLNETGFFIPTQEKVAQATVMANVVKHVDQGFVPDFDLLMRPIQDANAPMLPKWRGVGVSVPYEPAIDRKSKVDSTPFSIASLSSLGQLAFRQATTAVLEAAAGIQNLQLSDLYKNQPSIVVDES
jgi:hypothetical protein